MVISHPKYPDTLWKKWPKKWYFFISSERKVISLCNLQPNSGQYRWVYHSHGIWNTKVSIGRVKKERGDSRKNYCTRCHRTWPAEKEKEIERCELQRWAELEGLLIGWWEGKRESWVPPLFFIGAWDICSNKRRLKNSAYAEKEEP